MSVRRDYLSAGELESIMVQCRFVAPLCIGPYGAWIEGTNPKQVAYAKRFVEKLRNANKPDKVTP